MNTEIVTSININATPEKIWKTLLDFDAYPQWNPFISSISGVAEIGNTLEVQIESMKFKPVVLESIPSTELRWIGKLLFKGLFDGEHRFFLKDNKDGSTTFTQSEKFKGVLVPLFSKKINTEIKNGFINMNKSLKNTVEELNF
ncbi:SRPBCC domain-containing protein [Tenacibaculum jejuense]|uniref:Polyketide cyclase/dehydrase n=1 Tax=Tenacibaculum jejuense TaxID=584609 RepID=A0A238UB09_9FLAO|nr:SRPBCC domain-containing protein [Tenacibaculum jejuense]SNR16361.1 conserved protein of unknown function [Tenacibaculum jejuense]